MELKSKRKSIYVLWQELIEPFVVCRVPRLGLAFHFAEVLNLARRNSNEDALIIVAGYDDKLSRSDHTAFSYLQFTVSSD